MTTWLSKKTATPQTQTDVGNLYRLIAKAATVALRYNGAVRAAEISPLLDWADLYRSAIRSDDLVLIGGERLW